MKNILNINYFEETTKLAREAFSFKKYKLLHPAIAVFTGLFLLPFVVVSLVMFAVLLVLSYLFEILRYPLRYIHGVTTNEAKDRLGGAQFIIYLISWPIILIYYCVLAFEAIAIVVFYLVVEVFFYLWSIGGFRFHAFPGLQDMAKSDEELTCKNSVCLTFIIVSVVILVLATLIHGVAVYAELHFQGTEDLFSLAYYIYYVLGFLGFTFVYGLIAFNDFKRVE